MIVTNEKKKLQTFRSSRQSVQTLHLKAVGVGRGGGGRGEGMGSNCRVPWERIYLYCHSCLSWCLVCCPLDPAASLGTLQSPGLGAEAELTEYIPSLLESNHRSTG